MDTSKHICQLHGVDDVEMPVRRRKLRRKDMIAFFEKLAPTRIAIEACGASHCGDGRRHMTIGTATGRDKRASVPS